MDICNVDESEEVILINVDGVDLRGDESSAAEKALISIFDSSMELDNIPDDSSGI